MHFGHFELLNVNVLLPLRFSFNSSVSKLSVIAGETLTSVSVEQTTDKHANLASMNGGQVDSLVACFRVDAVQRVLLAGVFGCGLGEQLVHTFSGLFLKKLKQNN